MYFVGEFCTFVCSSYISCCNGTLRWLYIAIAIIVFVVLCIQHSCILPLCCFVSYAWLYSACMLIGCHADIDECATVNGMCHQECNNTVGGRNCFCSPGYELSNDTITCTGSYNYRHQPI